MMCQLEIINYPAGSCAWFFLGTCLCLGVLKIYHEYGKTLVIQRKLFVLLARDQIVLYTYYYCFFLRNHIGSFSLNTRDAPILVSGIGWIGYQ